ncbi:uncharacterized protein [Littorina saxatilis]|uniref:uncharacterized protein n=1 Tax=Littorina saxatilis TaxID=31220 RepID=UPI0038B555BD
MVYYHLIEWANEDTDKDGKPGVSVVPDGWLVFESQECMWPPNATTRMMRNNMPPRPDWAKYRFTKMVKSSSSWDTIKILEKKYLEKSDINTTEDESDSKKRKRTPRVLWESPATSPERASPSPPPPPSLPPLRERSAASPAALSLSPPPPPQRERSAASPAVLLFSPPQRERSAAVHASPLPPREEEQRSADDFASPRILSVEAIDYKPFFEALLRNQEQIKAALNQQRGEIHSLRAQVKRLENGSTEGRGESSSRPELPAGFVFPLESEDELRRLERELADQTICKQLERHLYNLGGSSFRVSLRAAGGTLLAPSLQGRWNLTGSNKSGQQKLAFNSLTNVKRVLYNAVHERYQTPKDTFNSYLGDWLSTWRDRLSGGKKNRVGGQQKDS